MVAGLDDAEDAADAVAPLLQTLAGAQPLHQLVLHDAGAAIEEPLHHLEEVGVVLFLRRLAVVPPRTPAAAPRRRHHCPSGRRRRRPARLRARQHRAGGQAGRQQLPQVAVHGGGRQKRGSERCCRCHRRGRGPGAAAAAFKRGLQGGRRARGARGAGVLRAFRARLRPAPRAAPGGIRGGEGARRAGPGRPCAVRARSAAPSRSFSVRPGPLPAPLRARPLPGARAAGPCAGWLPCCPRRARAGPPSRAALSRVKNEASVSASEGGLAHGAQRSRRKEPVGEPSASTGV